MDIVVLKVIILFLILSVTFIFSMIPLLFIHHIQKTHDFTQRLKYQQILSYMSCAAGGVFIGTCILDLLPDVQNEFDILISKYGIPSQFPIAEFIIVFGMLLVLSVEQIILDYKETSIITNNSECEILCYDTEQIRAELQLDHSMSGISAEVDFTSSMNERRALMTKVQNTISEPAGCDASDGHKHDDLFDHSVHIDISSHSAMRSFLLLMAISLHSIFEGMAVGLQTTIDNALGLFLVIIFHKAVISLSVGLNMVQSKLSFKQIVYCNLFFCITAPIGVGMGIGIMEMPESVTTSLISGILQGIACGTFLFVTFFEVLPHEFNRGRGRLMKLLYTIIGFSAVCLMLYLDPVNNEYVCHKKGSA